MPDPAKSEGLRHLDRFATSADPQVVMINSTLQAAVELIEVMRAQLKDLMPALNDLIPLGKVFVEIAGILDPIYMSLKDLDIALRRKFRIAVKVPRPAWSDPFRTKKIRFTFTCRQIIRGINTGFDWVNRKLLGWANDLLRPILRTLNLEPTLPAIPGLELIDGIQIDFLDELADLDDFFDAIEIQFVTMVGFLDAFEIGCEASAE